MRIARRNGSIGAELFGRRRACRLDAESRDTEMKKRKPGARALAGGAGTPRASDDGDRTMRIERKAPYTPATGPPDARVNPIGGRSERPAKTRRGRLSRAVMAALGKGLADSFDEIRREEVPERLRLLLQRGGTD